MIVNKETVYNKDVADKKIRVTREFEASPEKVWNAWTRRELLDQWWAPRPWKANTVSMDFREGGRWFYYMEGPDGSRHYCICDYQSIVKNKSYSGLDAFCDESQNLNTEFPRMQWTVEFNRTEPGTRVEVEISFSSVADLEKIIEMGFKEGFAAAHTNLDELLASGF
jgi:uncharacterized protein YndB with AHSA1/START domain